MNAGEQRAGVELTNLDQPLGPDAGATKRDLVDYLDAVADRILPGLVGRPLTVLRALRGRRRSCRRTCPSTPRTGCGRCRSGRRPPSGRSHYALCDDRRTLLWLANQRAIEYHPTLGLADNIYRPTHLVLDLDPPERRRFRAPWWPWRTWCGRRWPTAAGRRGEDQRRQGRARVRADRRQRPVDDVAAATRALAARAEALDPGLATTAFIVEDRAGKVFVDSTRAGGATVAAAYSPRLRPGTPVSFPLAWSDLDRVAPGRLHGAHGDRRPRRRDPWAESMPAPQRCRRPRRAGPHHPVARVAAMHEGNVAPARGGTRRISGRSCPISRRRRARAGCCRGRGTPPSRTRPERGRSDAGVSIPSSSSPCDPRLEVARVATLRATWSEPGVGLVEGSPSLSLVVRVQADHAARTRIDRQLPVVGSSRRGGERQGQRPRQNTSLPGGLASMSVTVARSGVCG